jgi:hypothetical protein
VADRLDIFDRRRALIDDDRRRGRSTRSRRTDGDTERPPRMPAATALPASPAEAEVGAAIMRDALSDSAAKLATDLVMTLDMQRS